MERLNWRRLHMTADMTYGTVRCEQLCDKYKRMRVFSTMLSAGVVVHTKKLTCKKYNAGRISKINQKVC